MSDWVEANHRYLTAALAVVRGRLLGEEVDDAVRRRDEVAAGLPGPTALDGVATAFGLSRFERETLLLAAGVELDSAVARACATAHGDPARTYATFSLAMATLPGPHWSATPPVAPLRRWRLLELSHPHRPSGSALRADERVVHALAGVAYLDPRVEVLAGRSPVPEAGTMPGSLRDATARLASCWSSGSPQARLYGRAQDGLRAVAAAAADEAGLTPTTLRAADLPADAVERDLLARLCERETALGGRCWVVEVPDGDGGVATAFAARLGAPVVLLGPGDDDGGGLVAIEVAPPAPGERRAAWRAVPVPEEWADRIAGQFDVGPEAVELPDGESGPGLWDACRRAARPALDGLAARVEPRAEWDDLVLPGPLLALLRGVAAHVRHRTTVFDDWGFGTRTARGTGAAALFAGPSGTGKTFAAEVLAADLALDLYRVDLSQVVNKYIGETEKNLRRIFDAAEAGGAVLLFDEADSLFGKRSEVRDSHDRHANIEVSYLLQRMETYRGLAILTTNQRSALDSAFLRRLRFVVPFPFPDAAGRAEIWRRVFPASVPTKDVDPARLARLTVAGGTIRSIALSAAFLAADAGEPVTMAHLLSAAHTEYTKLERPLTDTEVAGWTTT